MGSANGSTAERELFSKLSSKLEELAAESQALVDRAMAMAKSNALTPGAVTAPLAPVDSGESNGEPAEQSPGIDVDDV